MKIFKNKIYSHNLLIINTLLVFFSSISCKKNEVTKPSPEVLDYPKAYVVNGASNNISIINLTENTQTKIIQLTDLGRYPHHISLSPDGAKLAVAVPEFDFTLGHAALHNAVDKKGGIVVIDTQNGNSILKMEMPYVNFNAAFSPDGTEIWSATSSHTGDMYVFDSKTGQLKKQIPLGLSPSEVTFTNDGKYAFIALSESSYVYVLDVSTKEIIETIKVDLYPSNTWTGADGLIYVENKTSFSVNIIDPKTMSVINYIDLNFTPSKIVYNKLQSELWICQAGDKKIAYFEQKNNIWTLKGTIITGEDAHAVSFSKDEKVAYVVNLKGNTVSVIDVVNHTKIEDITVGNQPNGIVLKE